MYRQTLTITIILCLLLTSFTAEKNTDITEANYLREDSLLWYGYEENANIIYRVMKGHPEKAILWKRDFHNFFQRPL